MSTEQKITISNGTETIEVTKLQWDNMLAGSTYGYKEVTSTPPELAKLVQSTTPVVNTDAVHNVAQLVKVAEQIAALEEQKKAPGLSPQDKANITKQINALKNAQA